MVAVITAIEGLRGLDWSDAAVVAAACAPVLRSLGGDKPVLRAMVNGARSGALAVLCEHYDILDKLVLHSDAAGVRIRLHLFADGYFDRPHTHRWPYTTIILRGSYEHNLFTILEDARDGEIPTLRPIMSRVEAIGDSYTLMPGIAHSVKAMPGTVSLIIRGPAVADKFLVTDRQTGEAWWQYGAANESADAQRRKRMSSDQQNGVVEKLLNLGVI